MRSCHEFRQTISAGVRVGRRSVVVHVRPAGSDGSGPARVGFIVSKQIGNAVTRNRVKRRLRHLMRTLLDEWAGSDVVVRALPSAASEPARVESDLHAALYEALARSSC